MKFRGPYWIIAITLYCCESSAVFAWEFTPAIPVTDVAGPAIFHHVESSGRRNIAVSGDQVAVVWEDNRDDVPRIYFTHKKLGDSKFVRDILISGSGEAYEPSIVALDNRRFVVAWEENARIVSRLVTTGIPGPPIVIAEQGSNQASLFTVGGQPSIVFARREGRFQAIRFQQLQVNNNKLVKHASCKVDTDTVKADQLYPTAVNVGGHSIVAWEDRRPGHTIIMASQSGIDSLCQFSKPHRISDAKQVVRNVAFGKGHGVSRVALARFGKDGVLAAWADKRDFREGYDIYAANYDKKKKRLFGDNVKVQDSFGGHAQQWHAAVAGHETGQLVVAWDDKRDGDANIMLSWFDEGEWSEDIDVSVASGKGEQAHPSIAFDGEGYLHIVWAERMSLNGSTRILYARGKPLND